MKFKVILEAKNRITSPKDDAEIYGYIGGHPNMFEPSSFYVVSTSSGYYLIETREEYNGFDPIKRVNIEVFKKYGHKKLKSTEVYNILHRKV